MAFERQRPRERASAAARSASRDQTTVTSCPARTSARASNAPSRPAPRMPIRTDGLKVMIQLVNQTQADEGEIWLQMIDLGRLAGDQRGEFAGGDDGPVHPGLRAYAGDHSPDHGDVAEHEAGLQR